MMNVTLTKSGSLGKYYFLCYFHKYIQKIITRLDKDQINISSVFFFIDTNIITLQMKRDRKIKVGTIIGQSPSSS